MSDDVKNRYSVYDENGMRFTGFDLVEARKHAHSGRYGENIKIYKCDLDWKNEELIEQLKML
jgi:hypothetical protein